MLSWNVFIQMKLSITKNKTETFRIMITNIVILIGKYFIIIAIYNNRFILCSILVLTKCMECITYRYQKKKKELLYSYKTSYLTESITYIEEIFIVCVKVIHLLYCVSFSQKEGMKGKNLCIWLLTSSIE